MHRIFAGTTVALALLVGLSIMSGSAARLDVTTAPQASVSTETACAPAVAAGQPVVSSATAGTATAGNYTRVAVSGIPVACQNLPMQVTVHGESGTLLQSALAPAGANGQSLEVPVANYTGNAVTDVIVRINGWIFPTNWAAPAPANPTPPIGAVTCYEADSNGNVVTDAAGNGVLCAAPSLQIGGWDKHLQIQFSLQIATPVIWVFDFSHSAFATQDFDRANSQVRVNPWSGPAELAGGYDCSELPIFEVVLRPSHGNLGGTIQVEPRQGPATGVFCTN